MADVDASEEKTLEDLQKEITCSVCQEHYNDPKVLPCLHYYCKECILRLAKNAGIKNHFACPECRHESTLPEGGVEELKTAFFVNRLKSNVSKMEIAHGKVDAKCEICLEKDKEKAEAFCRQCAMFICNNCVKYHQKASIFISHRIDSLQDLKRGRSHPVIAQRIMCPSHEEPLTIYCEDCKCLICRDCTVKDHKEHNYEFCKKAAPSTRKEVSKELEPLKELIANLSNALMKVQTTKQELKAQGISVAAEIQAFIAELCEILNKHEKELLNDVERTLQDKLKSLLVQEKNLSLASAEIQSVVEYTEQCLRLSTDNEVMNMKTEMMSRIEREIEMHHNTNMEPVEDVDVGVETSCADDLQQLCLAKANMITLPIDLAKSLISAEITQISEVNEESETMFKFIPILSNYKMTKRDYVITAEIKSLCDGAITKCDINKTEASKYSIKYTPTVRGRHELTVFVDGQQVPDSPFPVFVSIPPTQLGKAVQVWNEITKASGITINSAGEVIVTEYEGDIVKLEKEGKKQPLVEKAKHSLNSLCGIAVDGDDNIYCTDQSSSKILTCDKNGGNSQVHEVKTEKGAGHRGVAVVGDEVMVCEVENAGTITVYNKDLQHTRDVKHEGFGQLYDVSTDSHHNVYAADWSDYIRVFKNDGTSSHEFNKGDNDEKKVNNPHGVHVFRKYVYVVCNNDSVSVFTTDGVYAASFSNGGGSGPHAIATDRDGFVYVTDRDRNRVTCF